MMYVMIAASKVSPQKARDERGHGPDQKRRSYMKKTSILISFLLAGAMMSTQAYADVISDAPVDIGSAPVMESEAGAGTNAGSAGIIDIDISALSNLPAASFNAPEQETQTEALSAGQAPTGDSESAVGEASPVMEPQAPSDNDTVVSESAAPVPGSSASSSAANEYSAPVQYVTVGGTDSVSTSGPVSASSESPAVSSSSSSASGNGEAGSRYAGDSRTRMDLGYTLVAPNVDYNGFKVAEGSAQLSDGSWEAVGKNQYLRNRFYKLISEQTDSSGTGWYVVAAGGRQVGNYRTSDGSVLSEIWLKKSDCTVQNYLDLNTANSTRQQIVRNALSFLGKRYQFAASGPDAFDCSGFVNYIMSTVGISVPRSSSEICGISGQISAEELRPGDIVGRPGHVGIYIGDGWFVHASESSTGVITESLEIYNRYNHFTNFINVVGD